MSLSSGSVVAGVFLGPSPQPGSACGGACLVGRGQRLDALTLRFPLVARLAGRLRVVRVHRRRVIARDAQRGQVAFVVNLCRVADAHAEDAELAAPPVTVEYVGVERRNAREPPSPYAITRQASAAA